MVSPARVGRGSAFLASIAFVFAPSLASATSFASGSVSVHESRAFAVPGRATLSAALAAPLGLGSSRPRARLEIFFGRNRLRIHSVAPGEVRFHGVEPATNPIPEPTAALLFGVGLCVVGAKPSRGRPGIRARSAR